jgi:hypothetical protein
MANKPIGTPRFYVDFSQLARIKGMWSTDKDIHMGSNNLTSVSQSSFYGQSAISEVWLGDYTSPKTFKITDDLEAIFRFTFYYKDGSFSSLNSDWAMLMEQMDYIAVVNHNFKQSFSNENVEVTARRGGSSVDGDIVHPVKVEGDNIISLHNGFFLGTLPNDFWSYYDTVNLNTKRRHIEIRFQGDNMQDVEFKIGSLMFGTTINMPFSPDLRLRKSVTYDGVNVERGVSGSDVVYIDNHGLPNFIQGSAWKNLDYSMPHGNSIALGEGGRRKWDLKFSYITPNKLFTKQSHDKPEGFLDNAGNWISFSAEGDIERLYNYTLGGALPFLFCPDPSQNNAEYAMCRFATDGFTASQVAHNVFDISMSIEEIW